MKSLFLAVEWLFGDMRMAFRTLWRSPTFTVVAVVSLALGIGANAAIFSFVNAIVLKHLPVPEPDRLVRFAESARGETSGAVWRMTTVDAFAKRNSVFSGVMGWFPKAVSFSRGDTARWVMGELVTGEYFDTLEIRPALGRLFTDEDVRDAKANPVCVISYAFWQKEFAGDPAAISTSIFLNGHRYRVIGVTARGFYGAALQGRADLQVPATRIGDFMPAFGESTGVNWLKTLSWMTPLARLKPGLDRSVAEQRAQAVFRQIEMEDNGGRGPANSVQLRLLDGSQGFDQMRSSFGKPAIVLLAIAGVVLLVTCANLASLLLARAQARGKEFAVRLSIGGSRSRVIQQIFVECSVIAACGGCAGVIVSFWVTNTLLAYLNTGKSNLAAIQVHPDQTVLLFSLVLSVATAILFGLIPAWQATRQDFSSGLKQEFLGGGFMRRGLLRRLLVVAQIVLSLVVIFAAGLLTRTLRTLQTIDLGFRPERVIALSVDPTANGHSNADVTRVLDQILGRVRALPGVAAASLAASTPYGSLAISLSFEVPGYKPRNDREEVADFNCVSPGYFATLGQPLLLGRDFAESDVDGHPRVAIVNEHFARHFWAKADPIGRKFNQGGSEVEIVGMVRDARDRDLRSGPADGVYLSTKQAQTSGLTLLVRANDSTAQLIPSLLAIVASIDKRMPVYAVHTLDVQVEAGLSSERILGNLSAMFALLAPLLAGIGLYGLMAYSVTRRTREIGIRLSTGAQRRDIGMLFARESFTLVAVGLLIGIPVALLCVNILKSLLFGVTATDMLTLALSALVLILAGLLATSIPLRRATRVSPMVALRYE